MSIVGALLRHARDARPGATLRVTHVALAACLLAVVGSGCPASRRATPAPDARGSAEAPAACAPRFPLADGWYGGDVASSVALSGAPAHDTVWLFGDSFVERPGPPEGRHYPFVANSIGRSRCDERGRFVFETHWRRDGPDAPGAFFEPPSDDYAWWPLAGFVAGGRLHVGLLRVAPSPPRGPLALPFAIVGMDLATIADPTTDPARWRVTTRPWSRPGDWHPGAAFAVHDGFVYAFAFRDRDDGRSPRALTRLPLDALERAAVDLIDARETLDREGRWRRGLSAERAALVLPDDATEMSVHFEPVRGRWLVVDLAPRPAGDAEPLAGTIRIRHARRLEGPWSAPEPLYAIPELRDPPAGVSAESLFCYAGKAHPSFSNARRLLVTYVCNLFARTPGSAVDVLRRLAETPALYRPRAVSVPIPWPLPGTAGTADPPDALGVAPGARDVAASVEAASAGSSRRGPSSTSAVRRAM